MRPRTACEHYALLLLLLLLLLLQQLMLLQPSNRLLDSRGFGGGDLISPRCHTLRLCSNASRTRLGGTATRG